METLTIIASICSILSLILSIFIACTTIKIKNSIRVSENIENKQIAIGSEIKQNMGDE